MDPIIVDPKFHAVAAREVTNPMRPYDPRSDGTITFPTEDVHGLLPIRAVFADGTTSVVPSQSYDEQGVLYWARVPEAIGYTFVDPGQ